MILGYKTFPSPSDSPLNHMCKYVLCDSSSLLPTATRNGNKSSFQSQWTVSILKSPGTTRASTEVLTINHSAEGQNLTSPGKPQADASVNFQALSATPQNINTNLVTTFIY